MESPPSISRPSPPKIASIAHAGIRYEQDRINERNGDQNGGYLVAIDTKSGARLWRIRIYDVPDYRSEGVEMGGIYFRSMRLTEDAGELEIENEAGAVYRIDLTNRNIRKISGPPDSLPADTRVVPKPSPD